MFNLDLSNDVDDADGRDKEQVGDEATGGKRTKGTFNKDMTMCLRSVRHRFLFTLSQCRCDNIGKVRINVKCALCYAHEKNVRLRAYR